MIGLAEIGILVALQSDKASDLFLIPATGREEKCDIFRRRGTLHAIAKPDSLGDLAASISRRKDCKRHGADDEKQQKLHLARATYSSRLSGIGSPSSSRVKR